MNVTPGWQQSPVPPPPLTCPHLGLVGAVFSMMGHPVGHRWACICGQMFRVVSDGTRKRLAPERMGRL